MSTEGYYRYPAIFKDQVVFVSEDDLWVASTEGGVARRLTSGIGSISTPIFSPDGTQLAFAGSEEGYPEVYVMPSQGGPIKRLTFLGEEVNVITWTEEGIIFASSAGQPFSRWNALWCVSPNGGEPQRLPIGPANFISFKEKGSKVAVIQRHGYREYGFWKRYRGGTAGQLWIDQSGKGNFRSLLELGSDFARPLWIQDRIYFSSDHEGVGNLYSCLADGSDIKQHTNHSDYYVRNQSTDGYRIVYHAGGDIYLFDPQENTSKKVTFDYHSTKFQRNRKFITPGRYLEDFTIHPKGHHLAVVTRGKAFAFGNWEGAVFQLGAQQGVRFRIPRWLYDGERVLLVHDRDCEEILEIYHGGTSECLSSSGELSFGRAENIYPNPCKDEVILVNHRNEIFHIDLNSWKLTKIDRSEYSNIDGVVWSPDGEWVAYSCSFTRRTIGLKLYQVKTKKLTPITQPLMRDLSPAFDPEGKYLYFLSYRHFNPSWDALHFELGFPRGMKPYAIALQKDTGSPFIPKVLDLSTKEEEEKAKKKSDTQKPKIEKINIDLEGIEKRLIAFPIEEGLFSDLVALKGKIAYLSWHVEGALHEAEDTIEYEGGTLEVFDFDSQKVDDLIHNVSVLNFSLDHQWICYKTGSKLRVFKADEKPDDRDMDKPNRKNGWIDLSRLRVTVNPVFEWEQMYKEAWRLQRDHFWSEDMSKVDWQQIYKRYYNLLPRVGSRGELSDLLWEMQGELGTSHAYVYGGDLRMAPRYTVGQLAADFIFDPKKGAYRFVKIARGDHWLPTKGSPLLQPGLGIQEGDLLWAINHQELDEKTSPSSLLVFQANIEVALTISDKDGKNKRDVIVKTARSQTNIRYRDWVETNRAYIHEKSQGKVGYIHIPDMGAHGFAEFHRSFLAECDREGLIVDVRFNGGGNVSALLLEKLARRRLGYDASRHHGIIPYPEDSPAGPMVAITNEYAGSDGDMFSHAFKLMKLGPLIGKRTWGGVVGIAPRYPLVDGGMTTQPEFSFWFKDVGLKLENYGVDPDIEIDITPQDYTQGKDPQLERALNEVAEIMKNYSYVLPEFGNKIS